MTRTTTLARDSSRPSGSDEGFTLVELTVAMVLIAVVLSSLVGLQVKALQGVGIAKQRQAATALANQKVEQVRALPYDTVRLGLSTAKAANETAYITSGRLRAPWNEKVVVNASQTAPALSTVLESTVLDNATYRTRAFVTHPRNPDGTDSTSSVDFWLTVAVEWTSSLTKGLTKSVVVRTRAVYPAGCNGTVDHPYAGPCQAFHHATAGLTNGSISIAGPDATTSPLGGGFRSLDLALGGMSSNAQTEQTPSAQSSLMTAGLLKDSVALVPQTTVNPVSDVDPATAAEGTPVTAGLGPWSNGSVAVGAPLGDVVSTFMASSGSGVAATAQSASPACPDLAGASTSTGQPCSSSSQTQSGTSRLALDLSNVNGRNLPEFTLAAVAATSSSLKAYSGRFVVGTAAHCTGTSAAGCIAAGSSRSLDSVSAGALPPATETGDVVPLAGPLVTISNYRDSATAEAGVSSAAPITTIHATHPTDRRFGVGRAGTLSYWNGTSFTSVNLGTLTSDATYSVPSVTATYQAGGIHALDLAVSGQVVVSRPRTEQVSSAQCQPTACSGKATAGSVILQLNYVVSTPTSGMLARFTVTTNLGTVTASTSYRGVPSA